MVSYKTDKSIPETLNECLTPDGTVSSLRLWAERLETWGQRLFGLLIIVGIITTIMKVYPLIDDVDTENILPALITSLVPWGLYAIIEYCTYQVLAVLIRALASITHHTMITANVALYESSKKEDAVKAVPEMATKVMKQEAKPAPSVEMKKEDEKPAPEEAATQKLNTKYCGVWKSASMTFTVDKEGQGQYEHHSSNVNRRYDFTWSVRDGLLEITIDGIVDYTASFKLSTNGTALLLTNNELPTSDRETVFFKQ